MEPQFRFCTSADGTRIAIGICGDGPPLLLIPSGGFGMEFNFSLPEFRSYIEALAARVTVVMFDRRGGGASDRDVEDLSPETEVADVRCVVDAAGIAGCTVMTEVWSTLIGALFAARHRDRVERLVLWSPVVGPADELLAMAAGIRANWSDARRVSATRTLPDGPTSLQRTLSRGLKESYDRPETCARQIEIYAAADLDRALAAVTSPALVVARERRHRAAMHVTGKLARGELRLVPGSADMAFLGYEPIVALVHNYMSVGIPPSIQSHAPGSTAIILFTDIADSAALTERMGDAAFRASSRALDDGVRAAMRDAGGIPVEGKVLGDGVMGVFTSAANAIGAARRCLELSGELPVHIGLHAGDVIREADNVYGGAVNIASRICALCAPGEILVSQTIRDLARTSAGVTFEDRGERALKGIEDPVRVFAVQ
jgi:pimeloyl-ACP methyl ester carboxylesterase